MLCFTSCSTSTKFTVYGEPGTQILTPSRTALATIDNTGKVKIANPDDVYYAFLLSHKPGTEEYIPFALEYKHKVYSGSRIAKGLGMTLAGVGSIALLFGVTGELVASKHKSGENPMASALYVGLALDAVGLGLGMTGDSRSKQLNHKYNYKYLPVQQTNQDIQLSTPVFEVPPKVDTNIPTAMTPMASSKSSKTLVSSSSTKTFKDNATKIEGTYIGNGTLKQGNEIIETYNNISVTIKKKSKDVVLVNVVESDGSKFFTTDGEYTIKKQSNGKFVLTLKGINIATIEIDVTNNLVYIHPRVNIDGEIYKLNVNAKK